MAELIIDLRSLECEVGDGVIRLLCENGGGSISTDLAAVPDLANLDPNQEADRALATEELADCQTYNDRVDGFESFLLALFCEGVDVSTPSFRRAMSTAIQAMADN